MTCELLTLELDHARVPSARAILQRPDSGGSERGHAILLAHGAGASMEHPFMESMATGLAARGFTVMRFEYPYMARARLEERRLPPDRLPALADAQSRALALFRDHTAGLPIIMAGKSMGGRLSTLLAAGAVAAPTAKPQEPVTCAGLILFGYPLHPAGKPERLRVDHFPHLHTPALFLQGTRDALCDLALLRNSLKEYAGRATVEIIDGADHGFSVPKRVGRSQEEVREHLLNSAVAWIAGLD